VAWGAAVGEGWVILFSLFYRAGVVDLPEQLRASSEDFSESADLRANAMFLVEAACVRKITFRARANR
jgi:hypothetical protein